MPNSKRPGGVKGYVSNVAKEAKEFGSAWSKAWNASGEVGAGTDARANRLRKKQDAEMGQFFGSLTGKKYDAKGRRVR